MRLGRPKLKAIAAWLGILALIVNALVPIHLAFDLADALAGERIEQASADTPHEGRDLLGALAGHRDSGGKSDGPGNRHPVGCMVCSALGSLGGFAGTAAVALPTPALVDASALLTAARVELRGTSPIAYRSRAPPIG